MAGHSPTIDSKKLWGGGISPFNVSYGKVMMWFFLVSDAFTFSGLLVSYGFMRHRFEDIWPKAEDVFTHFPFMQGDHPLLYVALMTFILIMSSVTMVLAVESGHRMNKRGGYHMDGLDNSWRPYFCWLTGMGVVSLYPWHRARSYTISRWDHCTMVKCRKRCNSIA